MARSGIFPGAPTGPHVCSGQICFCVGLANGSSLAWYVRGKGLILGPSRKNQIDVLLRVPRSRDGLFNPWVLGYGWLSPTAVPV